MAIELKNGIWNLNMLDGCDDCKEKNKKVAQMVLNLLDTLGADTLFITVNRVHFELTVFAGSGNCSDEFDCSCDSTYIPVEIG